MRTYVLARVRLSGFCGVGSPTGGGVVFLAGSWAGSADDPWLAQETPIGSVLAGVALDPADLCDRVAVLAGRSRNPLDLSCWRPWPIQSAMTRAYPVRCHVVLGGHQVCWSCPRPMAAACRPSGVERKPPGPRRAPFGHRQPRSCWWPSGQFQARWIACGGLPHGGLDRSQVVDHGTAGRGELTPPMQTGLEQTTCAPAVEGALAHAKRIRSHARADPMGS